MRAICSAHSVVDENDIPAMIVLLSCDESCDNTHWVLVRIETNDFRITHQTVLTSHSTTTPKTASKETSEEICMNKDDQDISMSHENEEANFLSDLISLNFCPFSCEVLVIISLPSLVQPIHLTQLRSAGDLGSLLDVSNCFSLSGGSFVQHMLAAMNGSIEEKRYWQQFQDNASSQAYFTLVGGGFMRSSIYARDRYITLCFNTHTSTKFSDATQWVCYFRVDGNSKFADVRMDDGPFEVPFVIGKTNASFVQVAASYQASCHMGIDLSQSFPHPDLPTTGPQLLFAADEKLHSYFAGTNFPAGFVVLDRTQLYLEREDETDIVVQKPIVAVTAGSIQKGKRSLDGGVCSRGGGNNKRFKGNQTNDFFDEINVWDNSNIEEESESQSLFCEEIDMQGYELAACLNTSMRLRKQWIAAGGFIAKALTPGRSLCDSSSNKVDTGISSDDLDESKPVSGVRNSEIVIGAKENFPQANCLHGLTKPSKDDRTLRKVSFSKSAIVIPQRVLTSSQNIALRAARESLVSTSAISI